MSNSSMSKKSYVFLKSTSHSLSLQCVANIRRVSVIVGTILRECRFNCYIFQHVIWLKTIVQPYIVEL